MAQFEGSTTLLLNQVSYTTQDYYTAVDPATISYAPGAVRDRDPVLTGESSFNTLQGALEKMVVNETGGQWSTVSPISINSLVQGAFNRGQETLDGKGPRDGHGIGFDYFEKIFITPTNLDLGNVVSELVFDVELTNTYRRDAQTLDTITDNLGEGVSLSPSATPIGLAPLSTRDFSLTVESDGPPTIDGSVTFETTNGDSVTLVVTGNRIVIFPYVPEVKAEEQLEWLTNVIRVANGYEQRHQLRTYPRQRISYEYKIRTQSETAKIQNLFVDWTTKTFGVPLWWDVHPITADVDAGSNDIVIGSAFEYMELKVGSLVMLVQENDDGTDTFEVLQVQTMNTSPQGVTVTSNISNSYEKEKSYVVPVVAGILEQGGKVSVPQGDTLASIRLTFRTRDNDFTIDPDPTTYTTLADWDSIECPVIDDDNLLSKGSLMEDWFQEIQILDYGTGEFKPYTQELNARKSIPFTWIAETPQELYQIRELLYFMRGKLRNVWVPSKREDFVLAQTASAAATAIVVENVDFNEYVQGAPPFAGLVIRRTDGSVSYHRITGGNEIDSSTEDIEFTPAIGDELTVADVDRIELMYYARLNTDKVTLVHEWVTEGENLETYVSAGFIGDLRATS